MTAFRVPRGRRVPYLGAAPGLVPPVPLNLTEESGENEVSLFLRRSHLMRHQCDIKATPRPVDSQPIATPKRLQSHPNATLMRP